MIVQSPVQLHDINVAMTGQTGVIVQEGGGQLMTPIGDSQSTMESCRFRTKIVQLCLNGLFVTAVFGSLCKCFRLSLLLPHDACQCFALASVRATGCEYRRLQILVWKTLSQSRAERADKKAVKPRHNVPKKKHSAILACGPLQC